MHPSLLRTFLAVEKHRSHTRAAQELHLSQPAVSRQVGALEQELGVKLFELVGKSLSPTDAGRKLAEEAQRLLGDLERVVESVRAFEAPDRGSLRLGASTTPGFYVLPPILGRFHREHPGVKLSLAVNNSQRIGERLLRNELDLGLVGAGAGHADLILEPLLEDEIVLFSAPGHRLASQRGRKGLRLEDLADEVAVAREKGSATRTLVEERLRASGLRLDDAIALGCPEAVKSVVAGGLGWSFLSIHGLREDFARGRLKPLPIPGWELRRPLSIARHRGKVLSPAMRAFIEELRAGVEGAGKKRGSKK